MKTFVVQLLSSIESDFTMDSFVTIVSFKIHFTFVFNSGVIVTEINIDQKVTLPLPGRPAVDPRGSSGFPRTDGLPPAREPGGITNVKKQLCIKHALNYNSVRV